MSDLIPQDAVGFTDEDMDFLLGLNPYLDMNPYIAKSFKQLIVDYKKVFRDDDAQTVVALAAVQFELEVIGSTDEAQEFVSAMALLMNNSEDEGVNFHDELFARIELCERKCVGDSAGIIQELKSDIGTRRFSFNADSVGGPKCNQPMDAKDLFCEYIVAQTFFEDLKKLRVSFGMVEQTRNLVPMTEDILNRYADVLKQAKVDGVFDEDWRLE